MKKKLSLLLSIMMMLSLFTGCDFPDDVYDYSPPATSSSSSADVSSPSVGQLTPVTSTRNPLLPTPDPETSDMDTFSPSDDKFPDLNNQETMTAEWVNAFNDEYMDKRIRIVYVTLQGPFLDSSGNYLMTGYGGWRFHIDETTVDTVSNFIDIYGPDGLEYVVDGIVTNPSQADPGSGCKILLTNCNIEVAMGTPWWKDQHYGDNPYGDGDYGDYDSDYNDYDDGDTYYDDYYNYGEPIAVDARAVGNNVTRFLYNYDGQYIQLSNAYVRSIQSNYVYLVCSGDGTETTNYTCYFDDFGASGAINLNMDDYVIVTGVVDGDELFTDVVMKNCSFVKGYGSGSSTIYGNLNDAFGSVMDDIYGSGWRGIYGY